MSKNDFNSLVSIILPTYNRKHLISKSIESVLNQSYKHFELIIIDDGGDDGTEKLIRDFQKKDDRIKYIKLKKNKGAAAARNTGIKLSKGEYIAFQDSDDEWLTEKLEKQMNLFKSTSEKVGVVYSGFLRIESNKRAYIPFDWVVKRDGDIHEELLRDNFVGTPTCIIKKDCLNKIGKFEEKLPRLQDWELMLRISKYYDFIYIDEALVLSKYTPNSISSNIESLIKAMELILSKHFNDFSKNKKLLSKHYSHIGSLYSSNGQINNVRRYYLKAIRTYPFNIRILLNTICSFGFYRIFFKIKNNIYFNLKST